MRAKHWVQGVLFICVRIGCGQWNKSNLLGTKTLNKGKWFSIQQKPFLPITSLLIKLVFRPTLSRTGISLVQVATTAQSSLVQWSGHAQKTISQKCSTFTALHSSFPLYLPRHVAREKCHEDLSYKSHVTWTRNKPKKFPK